MKKLLLLLLFTGCGVKVKHSLPPVKIDPITINPIDVKPIPIEPVVVDQQVGFNTELLVKQCEKKFKDIEDEDERKEKIEDCVDEKMEALFQLLEDAQNGNPNGNTNHLEPTPTPGNSDGGDTAPPPVTTPTPTPEPLTDKEKRKEERERKKKEREDKKGNKNAYNNNTECKVNRCESRSPYRNMHCRNEFKKYCKLA